MFDRLIYNYFSDDDLLAISKTIEEIEKYTSGEIAISIKEKKPFLKNRSISELAKEEFFTLGLDKTKDKTAILVFISLVDKEFYILADTGIMQIIHQQYLDEVKNEMQKEFREGHYLNGVVQALNKLGEPLKSNFPVKPDDTNEISNKVNF